MPTAWVIEAVDVLEDGGLGLAARFPSPAPDQLGLDGLEEGLDGRIVVAVALAAHRYLEGMFAQDLLVVVRTILAARCPATVCLQTVRGAVAVEDATPRRGSQSDSHFQRPDRQIAFHAVADGPADVEPLCAIGSSPMARAANAGPGSQPDTATPRGSRCS